MARCLRCGSCQSQWDFSNCKSCNYPDKDKRTEEQIKEDNDFLNSMYYKEDDDA